MSGHKESHFGRLENDKIYKDSNMLSRTHDLRQVCRPSQGGVAQDGLWLGQTKLKEMY